MLRVEIKELQMLSIQNAKLTEELAIIIKGSETLGVEGIRVRQQKDDLFKQHISNRFEELKEEFDRKSEIIEGHLDDRLVLLQSKVDNLEDWKTTWTKAIDLITNSKTWKLAFIVGLGVAGLVIFIKFKALDIIDALQEYLNTK
jgi:hypothetical protein